MSDLSTLETVDPSEGAVGYMSWHDFNRLEWAVHNALKHIPWWRVCGNINSRDPLEGAKGKPVKKDAHPLPLPAPWIAAEDISRLLGELNRWPELSDAANDLDGEYFARLLTREVETSVAKWPLSDRPHKIRYYRCQSCDQLTLKYFPPSLPSGDESTTITWRRRFDAKTDQVFSAEVRPAQVRCTDKACRAIMGELQWEIAARVAAQEHEEQKAKAKVRRAE